MKGTSVSEEIIQPNKEIFLESGQVHKIGNDIVTTQLGTNPKIKEV